MKFLNDYFSEYKKLLEFDKKEIKKILTLKETLKKLKKNKKKILIFGNGGSAAIASHFSVDLTKNAKIKAVNFNEADLITCFANDYGYENWIKKAIEYYSEPGDILILVSSSGTSKNIVNAANYAKRKKIKLITFTGINKNNPIKKIGNLNFFVNSKAYNIVESIHQIMLLSVVDLIIGKSEYKSNL
jgi:D-sedoheptulose 7-phosphate isomerase